MEAETVGEQVREGNYNLGKRNTEGRERMGLHQWQEREITEMEGSSQTWNK